MPGFSSLVNAVRGRNPNQPETNGQGQQPQQPQQVGAQGEHKQLGHAPSSTASMSSAPEPSAATLAPAIPPQPLNAFVVANGVQFDVDPKYRLLKPIGSGAYGTVCSAENLSVPENSPERKVAIKKISGVFNNLLQAKRTLREIKLLRQFKHSNINPIFDLMCPGSYETFNDIYIVTELMDADLHLILSAPEQQLTDEHVQYFVYQMLRGLKYIHSGHVIHRDLKPGNILVKANCDLKICDFGLARGAAPDLDVQGALTEYVATRWYRAPEIMLSWKDYSKSIDVWSVGCIFAEILMRRPIFQGRDYIDQLNAILSILGTPSMEDIEFIQHDRARGYIANLPICRRQPFTQLIPNANPQAIDLLEKMLTFSPTRRITVDEALCHPYLAHLHDPNDEPEMTQAIDFSYERVHQDRETLKELMWAEICTMHPHMAAYHAPKTADQLPQIDEVEAQMKAQRLADTAALKVLDEVKSASASSASATVPAAVPVPVPAPVPVAAPSAAAPTQPQVSQAQAQVPSQRPHSMSARSVDMNQMYRQQQQQQHAQILRQQQQLQQQQHQRQQQQQQQIQHMQQQAALLQHQQIQAMQPHFHHYQQMAQNQVQPQFVGGVPMQQDNYAPHPQHHPHAHAHPQQQQQQQQQHQQHPRPMDM